MPLNNNYNKKKYTQFLIAYYKISKSNLLIYKYGYGALKFLFAGLLLTGRKEEFCPRPFLFGSPYERD